jgi:hypothetical protein
MPGRQLAAVVVVSLLLSGCASGSAQLTPDHAQPTAEALSLWKDFPAQSSPRPLVLTGPAIDDPATGFPDGDDKEAYISGHFTVATTLPGGSPSWQQQPLITADQALAQLRDSGQEMTPPTSASLSITAVTLGTATFSTDRGQRSLPAWVFRFAGVHYPASVLAIAPTNRWPKTPPPSQDGERLTARISPGGDTVTITFFGAAAGTGPCDAQYAADIAQSSTAVAVSVRELPAATSQPAPSGDVAMGCADVGYRRELTVRLTPALAGRVLIDSYGAPIPAG